MRHRPAPTVTPILVAGALALAGAGCGTDTPEPGTEDPVIVDPNEGVGETLAPVPEDEQPTGLDDTATEPAG